MKAIIPVGGIGKRLQPHTLTTPKVLLYVAGKPILAHILEEVAVAGINEVVLVVGHLGERIEAYARENFGWMRLSFVPQRERLGNGHAVYVAREHLDGSPVLIVFGDTIIKGDIKRLLGSTQSMAGVKEVEDPRRLGVVQLDSHGYVQRLIEKPEKPPTNLAVIGAYLIRNSRALRVALERQIAENRQVRGEFWLADGLQLMIDAGERMGVFAVKDWYDCGTIDALLQANRALLDLDPPTLPRRHAMTIPPSYIDPTAEIEDSTIGPHTSIAARARVVSSTISDSVIGPAANIENSRLEHSLVGEGAMVRGRRGRINVATSGEGETP